MKKLTKKQMKIITISIAIILTILLIISIIGLVKTIKNNKNQEVVNLNDEIETLEEELLIDENDTTEINIEELGNIDNNENIKENDQKTKNYSNSNYYIKINYTANVVTIYTKDNNGEYTIPYKAMICSTGTGTPRSGTYAIKSRWRWGALFGGVYGQYCVHIVGNILFHSVPYTSKSQDALEYWEYDKLRNISFNGMHKIKSIRCIMDLQ